MDAAFIQALQVTKNPEDKAALIAEAGLKMFSNEIAQVARQCVLFHWFDQSIIEGLLQAMPSNTVSSQDVYRQITSLPFVEQLPWGAAYQDLTRQGLLKYYAHTQPDLLKSAARLATPLYRASTENERYESEALFCALISGDMASGLHLNTLLEQAMSRQDWQQMESLFRLQEEAEQFFFVGPLPRTEQNWMLRSIVDRVQGKLDAAITDYDHALSINPKNALAYLNRSVVHAQLGHHEQAQDDHREAVRLDSGLVQTYVACGALVPLQQARDASESKPVVLTPWWIQTSHVLWKITSFLATTVILALTVNIASTWFTSPKGTVPPDSPTGILLAHWPVILPIGFSLLLLTILTWWLSQKRVHALVLVSLEGENRERMLRRLRSTYNELMGQSLQREGMISLGFHEHPDAVRNASTLLLRSSNQSERPLPPDISILETYDQAGHELLVLGEPGTGKSTLLLDLAQQLVQRTEADATHPLPVILPLSTWALKRSSLHDWIAQQLSNIYHVPRRLSEQWVREEAILPLLDGLDEMEESARPACIAAINAYHHEHLVVPLVVCSRKAEYEIAAAAQRLALQSAVVVQPLTREQVDAYLLQAGKPLAALRSAMKENRALYDLASTPLMLSVLLLTYQGMTSQTLSKKKAQLHQQIWVDYIERMVEWKGNAARYPLHKTSAWLGWLAKQMLQRSQTIFYIEHIQPDWLMDKGKKMHLSYHAAVGLIVGLIAGLAAGLLFGQIFGLVGGLIGGGVAGLIGGVVTQERTEIQPAERIIVSWANIRQSMASGFVLGVGGVLGSTFGASFGVGFTGAIAGAVAGILSSVLIAGLVTGGVSSRQLEPHERLVPNEGVRRSLRNSVIVAFISGLVGALAIGLSAGVAKGLSAGIAIGLAAGLINGGLAYIQHFTLRLFLWRTHAMPWKYAQFLDDAVQRTLLRRVGGGYSFIHRLLLDYFASLELDSDKEERPLE